MLTTWGGGGSFRLWVVVVSGADNVEGRGVV